MPKVDLSKPVRTVGDKTPVTIFPLRLKGDQPTPVIGIIHFEVGDEPQTWTEEGKFFGEGDLFGEKWGEVESALDLENVPSTPKQKLERWINVYPNPKRLTLSRLAAIGYMSKEDADAAAGLARLACVYVECEEGDGL